jgi:hypothetical protein
MIHTQHIRDDSRCWRRFAVSITLLLGLCSTPLFDSDLVDFTGQEDLGSCPKNGGRVYEWAATTSASIP